MATKHSDIRIDDIVATKATLKAMLLKIDRKEGKVSKEAPRRKRTWTARVTDSERVALSAVLAAMRIDN